MVCQFPRLTVSERALQFNQAASEMITTRHVLVHKVGGMMVFLPAKGAEGFPVCRRRGRDNYCVLHSADLAKHRGLIPGKQYRVFEYKGGCAVNTFLPVEEGVI